MHIRRTPAALAALTTLALVLTGCSGSEDDDPAAAEEQSPLAEYFDAVYGGDLSPEEQEQQFAEQQEQQEELIAVCMQEQGFEYTPNVQSGGFYTSDGGEWEPDDRDWVGQYGYGAVNSPFSEAPPPEEEYVDLNADYVASLSPSEQEAFYEALSGPPPSEEEMAAMEEGGSYEYDWETAGCQGAAQHEVAGEDVSESDEFKPLFDAIDELYADMASWPGMAELDGEWATCMDAAGHGGFATQMDAQNSLYEDLNEIYESGVPAETGTGEPDQAALDALAEREVDLALADLDCREETDYRDRYAEITREVEQQFVDDHETELEAMKAAAEQDGP